MDLWVEVALIALDIYIIYALLEWKYEDNKKMKEVRERFMRMKESGKEPSQEELLEATSVMNKILLRRILISVVFLIPLWWVYRLGSIATPLGEMGAIWWYTIVYIIIAGGVWVGRALQKKAKAGKG
jgi:hypothetical protein